MGLPDGEMPFLEIFHSKTAKIYHFDTRAFPKIRLVLRKALEKAV
jgi:hypothetical protein